MLDLLTISRFEVVNHLKAAMIAVGTSKPGGPWGYEELRQRVLGDPGLALASPEFLLKCNNGYILFRHLQAVSATYEGRRTYIRHELKHMYYAVEYEASMVAASAELILENLRSPYVDAAWKKMVSRTESDPEGAITSARSLLESVFKAVLDEDVTDSVKTSGSDR